VLRLVFQTQPRSDKISIAEPGGGRWRP